LSERESDVVRRGANQKRERQDDSVMKCKEAVFYMEERVNYLL
jgi:hypothetical protein